MGYGGSFFNGNAAPMAPSAAVAANDGLSLTGINARLGQLVGAAGDPAKLLQDREIPLNAFNLLMTGIGALMLNKTVTTGEKLQLVGGFLAENGFGAKIQLDTTGADAIDLISASGTITINGNSAVIQLFTDNITNQINAPGRYDIFQGSNIYFRLLGSNGHVLINTVADNGQQLQVEGGISQNQPAALMHAVTAMTNGAAAQVGTLTNAPSAGNPTKWIPFDDAGVTRYIPAW
jgi:hypothetical protein